MNWTTADIEKIKATMKEGRPATPTPTQRLQALGRLPAHKMNKTEAAYARLLEVKKQVGEIAWFAFEPMNLRIAEKCFYRVDFMVMLADGRLEAHEVKGGVIQDDSLVKVKAAAAMFPFQFYIVQFSAKGGWIYRKF